MKELYFYPLFFFLFLILLFVLFLLPDFIGYLLKNLVSQWVFLTVGNISISIIINSIRINLSWIGNMAPDTKIAKIKMLEDSIDSAKKKANQKYDQLITLLKEQGQKMDHTTDNHRAQIGDIKNMISGLTQQINKHLTKMS